jgi:glycosyltransferase involved in cell wall biosynthesis
MTLRFSIIVPTLDRREMLLTALASIRAQAWPDTEIIVVDGGSSDGTLEAMAREPDISLIAGPDRGVYDAFNRGIARAAGEVVGILNSDDCYEPGAFSAVAAAFAADPGAQSVCGTALMVAHDRIMAVFDKEADKSLASPRTTLIASCAPNARFFRRTAMARIGSFSLDYKYVSDRDWLTRWYEAGLVTATIPDVVYRYRQHPGSMTFDADRKREMAIRAELLVLARRWTRDASASRETRTMARALEGRCVFALFRTALRRGRFTDAVRLMTTNDGRLTLSVLGSLAIGGGDWASRLINHE